LVVELKILAVLEHPNIIKIRGRLDGNSFHRENFIVLDKLYETLKTRISSWKKQSNKVWNKAIKKKKLKLFNDRLLVAYDLSSAFVYLHERNIVYRDIKPDNIGFDVRGDVKIFDFGLAKELPPRLNELDYTLYRLSANTGSLRYMAPEVALGNPYNLSVDVYSFAILLWQILSMETPFSGYNVKMHHNVVIEKNGRPKLNPKWPENIADIMNNSWVKKIEKRISFKEINKILQDDLDSVELNNSGRTARSLK